MQTPISIDEENSCTNSLPIVDADGAPVCEVFSDNIDLTTEHQEMAARIVASVNILAELPTETLEAGEITIFTDAMTNHANAQRDALAAALRECITEEGNNLNAGELERRVMAINACARLALAEAPPGERDILALLRSIPEDALAGHLDELLSNATKEDLAEGWFNPDK